MSFIHAYFWNKKVKANDFDDLRFKITAFKPEKMKISVKPQEWKKNKRDNLEFNLSGAFSDIEKDLRILQKKFGRM